jgi:hypothetical protein
MSENGAQASGGLRALERIRRAYPTAPQRLVVPEFPDDEGNPLEVFYWPKTGRDEQTIDAREPKDQAERWVYTLILKAMDDQGKPLFQWGEARQLLQYLSFEVLARIVLVIMGVRPNEPGPTVEDAKRDIQADPPSTSNYTLEKSSTNP